MRSIVLGIVCTLFMTDIALANDINAKDIKFYAVMESDGVTHIRGKTINVKKGDRLQFEEYAPHSGQAPTVMDVAVVIINRDTEAIDIEVRLAISPKVGKVVTYQKTPDLPLHKQIAASAVWFTPIILLKESVKNVSPRREVEVTFRDVKLGEILKDYISRNLWPVMLNFEASVEPLATEETFKNNTVKRTLQIHMWE